MDRHGRESRIFMWTSVRKCVHNHDVGHCILWRGAFEYTRAGDRNRYSRQLRVILSHAYCRRLWLRSASIQLQVSFWIQFVFVWIHLKHTNIATIGILSVPPCLLLAIKCLKMDHQTPYNVWFKSFLLWSGSLEDNLCLILYLSIYGICLCEVCFHCTSYRRETLSLILKG